MVLDRREFALLVGAALLGVGACPTVAFGTTWSSQQRKTVGGVTYTFMSGIDEGLKPTASTSVAASGNVASRSFAARACLKNQLKAVVASSGWVYNATRSVKAVVSHTRPAGSYFSQGQVILGGRQHDASPSVVCYGAPEKYELNSRGMTVGPLPDSVEDCPPVLMSVVGVDGNGGYVRFADFDAAEAGAVIDVVDFEGVSIVDRFVLGGTD